MVRRTRPKDKASSAEHPPEQPYSLLNMRSISTDDDRTTSARIRDTAIACFADTGIDGTSIRAIAATAGVSPGLVIHHFGTKAALREACDEYVVRALMARKDAAVSSGGPLDPLGMLREFNDGPPITRYLARTLGDSSPPVARLVDALVHDGIAVTQHSVEAGMLNPTADEEARVAVLTIWSLGALVLHEHLTRILGEDLTADQTPTGRYLPTVVEILGRPVLTESAYTELTTALRPAAPPNSPVTRRTKG